MGVDERKIPRVKRLLFAGALLSLTLAAAYGYGVTRREANYRQLLLDGEVKASRDYQFLGGRRSSDGVWSFSYDKRGRLIAASCGSLNRVAPWEFRRR